MDPNSRWTLCRTEVNCRVGDALNIYWYIAIGFDQNQRASERLRNKHQSPVGWFIACYFLLRSVKSQNKYLVSCFVCCIWGYLHICKCPGGRLQHKRSGSQEKMPRDERSPSDRSANYKLGAEKVCVCL